MNTYELHLQSGTQYDKFTDVISFVGEDESGRFGILAHHDRMMTCLSYGLMKCTYLDNTTEYLAIPGGVLYFLNNKLFICTRKYLRNKNYQSIILAMDQELRIEEDKVRNIKESLQHLDEAFLKQLLDLKRRGHYEL